MNQHWHMNVNITLSLLCSTMLSHWLAYGPHNVKVSTGNSPRLPIWCWFKQYWGRYKMAAISQTTRILFKENVRISIKSSLKFVPHVLINNIRALVQIMAWRRPGDKPFSEAMVVRIKTHICVARSQWDTDSIDILSGIYTGDYLYMYKNTDTLSEWK